MYEPPDIPEQCSGLDFASLLKDQENSDPYLRDAVPSPYELHNLENSYWNTSKLARSLNSELGGGNILFHFNIQGLSAKFDNLVTFMNDLSSEKFENLPIVLALSETWLSDLDESSYHINGYHPIIARSRNDNSCRGGVAFYVRIDQEFEPRNDLDLFIPFVFESVFIHLKSLNVTLASIYRSPSSNIIQFLDQYHQKIYQLNRCNEKFFLFGDFNNDLLKFKENSHIFDFVDLTFEMGCIPLITKPTRIDISSATCIDNIITNNILQSSKSGIVLLGLSDHFPVFHYIPALTHDPRPKTSVLKPTKRNLSMKNIEKLNHNLKNHNWANISDDIDPNSAAITLNDILTAEIDSCCPLISVPKKSNIPN